MEPTTATIASKISTPLVPPTNEQTARLSAIDTISEANRSSRADDSENSDSEKANESVQVSNSLGQSSEATNLTRSRAIELYRAVAALI